jgi:YegS/Rv2252/BmrU family lipid kinase
VKVLLIFNPQAGNGRARRLLPEVEQAFAESAIDLEVRQTRSRGHGMSLVADTDLSGFDGLAAAGGDGTLFEVVNGWMRNRGEKKPPIGVLPVGTGNAFSRDLDLKTGEWQKGIEMIAAGRTRRIDLGCFRAACGEYYFINILGLGFVSDVTESAAKLKVLGNLAYTLGVLHRTLVLRTHELTIEVDGRRLRRENLFMEISNSRYTADFLMAPDASLDDGLLDVTLAGKVTRRRLLRLFPKVFTGEHVHVDEVETFKASKLKVSAEPEKVLTPDGEILGSTPLEVECIPQALSVFV